MIRDISLPLVLRLLLFVFVCSVLIVQLGCSKSPEVAKTSPAIVVPSASPTLSYQSYQSFLDEGIDKCLNGQYKDAIFPLLKAKEMNPREGEIHFWLFQAYKNTETDTSKKSKAYIAAQNVIALMPGSPQEQQAQEFLKGIESHTQPQQFTPPPQVTATKSTHVSTQQPQIINTPSQLQESSTPEIQPPPLSQGSNVPILSDRDAKKVKEEYKRKKEEENRQEQARELQNKQIEYQNQREEAQRQHEERMKQMESDAEFNKEAAKQSSEFILRVMGK